MGKNICSSEDNRNLAILFLISAVLIAGCTAPAESGENVTGSAEGGFSEAPDQEGSNEGDIDDAESQEVENQTETEAEVEVVSENDSEEETDTSKEEPKTKEKINIGNIGGSWILRNHDTSLTSHSSDSNGPESKPERKWSYPIESPVTVSPVVKDNTVVFSSNKNLIALNASSGEQLWNFTSDKSLAQPVISGSTVYVATLLQGKSISNRGSGNIYGLRLKNGNLLMERETKSDLVNPPLPLGDSIYLPVEKGLISRTGLGKSIVEVKDLKESNIMLSGESGSLFASTGQGKVYRFSIKTGGLDQIWAKDVGTTTINAPVLGEDSVYVTPSKVSGVDLENTTISELEDDPSVRQSIKLRPSLKSLEKEDGDTRWVKNFDATVVSSPVLYGDSVTVMVSSPTKRSSQIKTYNRDTGELLWEKNLGGFHNTLSSGGDTLYIAGGSNIRALSHTGEDLWTKDIGSLIAHPPAIVGDYLFVGDMNGEVSAVGE